MSLLAPRRAWPGCAFRQLAVRVILTSGVLGGWFAVWWLLVHTRSGVL